jgi:hypothetical protein
LHPGTFRRLEQNLFDYNGACICVYPNSHFVPLAARCRDSPCGVLYGWESQRAAWFEAC